MYLFLINMMIKVLISISVNNISVGSNMKIKVYVVSLLDANERRNAISEQLLGKGFSFTIVDSVDFREILPKNLEHLYNIHPDSSLKRVITSGEVGCALSHIKTYEEFIATNYDYALILEDDAILDRVNPSKLEEYCEVLNVDYDVILLGYSKLAQAKEKKYYLQYPIKTKYSFDKYRLGEAWKNSASGAVGYIITRKGVEKILRDYSIQHKIRTVADDWLYFEKVCGLNILHVRPVIVFENFINLNSSLEEERAIVQYSNENICKDIIKYIRGFIRAVILRF